ncbi:2-succinyl-6-hydroxy-2,4-cyclohexadiene-1-carboxylate synthase [Piscirickettsia salmonis]|uniref:alpha/beta fold hydrolase n=1 Tax=Piscirickettsia salmonis TaxID=1238 RepID=UPI0012BA58E6|nr:alpha/beta hydrolase [Piscirickettsia salmonis]QGP54451.1 2-succinyl-6-hydroxy-2,4-cyclohexadiene-1-carboxylate synthase [Piscirickettsia salmonis]QGP64355.1 2-succinyl-6-hydroxy-2,4-cyclohexadiene-1-carboxylate synthase [Piscirickettsia salmonis]
MNLTDQHFISYQGYMLYQNMRSQGSDTLLVFIHGLGDSQLNYQLFFDLPELLPFDLVAPDLLGHGKSSWTDGYDYDLLVQCLYTQLAFIMPNYRRVILVPHSIGGILATALCQTDLNSSISGVFALETSLTQYGSYLSEKVSNIIKQGERFNLWFAEFKNNIYQQGHQDEITRLYYASLCLVDPGVFLTLALATRKIATEISAQEFTNSSGTAFAMLDIPKVYCLGVEGNQQQSLPFLQAKGIETVRLPTSSHWLAQSCPSEFIRELKAFIAKLD